MNQNVLTNLKNNIVSIKNINYRKRKILNYIIIFLMILVLPSFFKIIFPYMDFTFVVSLLLCILYWKISKEKKIEVLDKDLFSYLEIGINQESFFKNVDFEYDPLNIEKRETFLSLKELEKYENVFKSIIDKVSNIEKAKNIKIYKLLVGVILCGIVSLVYFKMDISSFFRNGIFQSINVSVEVREEDNFYVKDTNTGSDIDQDVGIDINGKIDIDSGTNDIKNKVNVKNYILNRFFTKKILIPSKSIVKIRVKNSFNTMYKESPSIELLNSDGSVFQVFKSYYNPSSSYYELEISLSKNQYLKIPQISSKKLALFITDNPDLPKVVANIEDIDGIDNISNSDDVNDLDPKIIEDDKELNVHINVESKVSLNKIYLEIKSSSKVHQEMVTQILNKDTYEYSTDYPLMLDQYLEEDIEDFEIVAVAEDNSIPTPLIGYSDPISIRVASAYGIYRSSLEKIKTVKSLLEEQLNTNEVSDKTIKLMRDVNKIAENLSFFDFWDRDRISAILRQLEVGYKDVSQVYDILEDINMFLFEHETLDFRERDRDFFIAIRTLSKMIKEKKDINLLNKAFLKLSSFLDERLLLWEHRVKRVESILNKTPSLWKTIKNKSLNKKLDNIKNIDNIYENIKVEENISSLTISYRSWIEELEKYEDEALKTQEDKKEQALSSLKEELKRIQKQQTEISKDLNDADKKERVKEIETNFPSIRLKQNSNIEASKSFKLKIAPYVPKAKNRLDLAIEAMEDVISEGEKSDFIQAESKSDLANRLLRQTESDAKNQRRKSSSSRSRRKLINDKYYGSSIINQDIKIIHQYDVDKKYRDQVLEDIERTLQDSSDMDQKHEKYLKKYLKEVVR